ncbi:MAG: hypothetical protein HY569_00005 [Candidatus Magasanikbacteria bacterium]|nr:hypothetical protein [Candidatus Magasanikbacteria bacterium]
MEEAWYHALSRGLWDILKLRPPKEYPNFYFFNKGLIEVWENKSFIQKIMGVILKKNSDITFFNLLFKRYAILVKKLKDTNLKDSTYIGYLFEAISIFAIFWYGIRESGTKKELQNKFVKIRDTDIIFDYNDKIVRQRILKRFPKTKGLETVIFKDEFLSTIPKKDALKKRLNNFISIPGKYSKTTKLNSFVKKINIEIEVFKNTTNGLVKGTTTYPGIIIGKVRIIKRKDEIDQMKKGEVLISPMTTPDVFIAIKKASAIVTDEGGQLCHAAIISRELKIPCIVGTKNASETYKNGDLVEVNADKGIVKMITQKK